MRKFIIPLFLSVVFFSCKEDELINDDNVNDTTEDIVNEEPTFESYEAEVFEDLTTADFDNISTPYETELSALTSARSTTSVDQLAELIAELFNGTLIESEDGEDRGLSVHVIKILFEDGSVVKVKVVQDIFEILSITTIPSDVISNELAVDGFISLSEAVIAAENLVDGTIVRWEISIEEGNVLEFEIHVLAEDGTRYEIELDAVTGGVIAQKVFENEEDSAEFEKEAEEETSDDNSDISEAVANFLNGNILFASTELNSAGSSVWNVLVETSSGGLVHLNIDSTTKELESAEGTDGPFDYEMSFLTDGVSFSEELESVEGQMGVEVDYWTYHYESDSEFSYWALIFYAEDEVGNKTTVVVHASSGEWISSETTPSDDFMEQLAIYTSAEIQYADRYDNEGNPFWDITLVNTVDEAGNTSGVVKVLIYEAEYEILRAYHNDETDVNYEFTFGGEAMINLSGAITKAGDSFETDIVAYDWIYYNSLEVNEADYSTLILYVSDDLQNFYTVYIDVKTGNVIKVQGLA